MGSNESTHRPDCHFTNLVYRRRSIQRCFVLPILSRSKDRISKLNERIVTRFPYFIRGVSGIINVMLVILISSLLYFPLGSVVFLCSLPDSICSRGGRNTSWAMDFLKSAVASAISKDPPFPYKFGDRVTVDQSIWTLYNGTKRVCVLRKL